eukprot:1525419-Pleurochrysis_carterae.AAC.1
MKRSSWEEFPLTCASLAWQLRAHNGNNTRTPAYSSVIESFARNWYLSGYPVPTAYASPSGQPPDADAQAR